MNRTLPRYVAGLVCLLLHTSLSAQNFLVQVAAFAAPVAPSYFEYKGLPNLEQRTNQNGHTIYIAGAYKTREEAEGKLQDVRLKGFPRATIIDVEEQAALCGSPCPYNGEDLVYAQIPGQQMTVQNIYFDSGSAALADESRAVLNDMFLKLVNNPRLSLHLLGHSDSPGKAEGNAAVSARRARAARNYLINKGIHADRLFIKVFGEMQPLVPNTDFDGSDLPQNRKLNRRVVLALIDPNGEVQDDKSISPGPSGK